jgi:hypothetical protein
MIDRSTLTFIIATLAVSQLRRQASGGIFLPRYARPQRGAGGHAFPGQWFAQRYTGLQNHSPKDHVYFRNVVATPLS